MRRLASRRRAAARAESSAASASVVASVCSSSRSRGWLDRFNRLAGSVLSFGPIVLHRPYPEARARGRHAECRRVADTISLTNLHLSQPNRSSLTSRVAARRLRRSPKPPSNKLSLGSRSPCRRRRRPWRTAVVGCPFSFHRGLLPTRLKHRRDLAFDAKIGPPPNLVWGSASSISRSRRQVRAGAADPASRAGGRRPHDGRVSGRQGICPRGGSAWVSARIGGEVPRFPDGEHNQATKVVACDSCAVESPLLTRTRALG